MTSQEFKRTKSSLEIDKRNKTEIDVILELYSNIMRKEDGDKCICSNIIPEVDNKNVFFENEIVPNLEVNLNSENKVRLTEIITNLKIFGYPLTGAMISVYFKDAEDFVFMGSDPIENTIQIGDNNINNKIVKIRAISYIEDKFINLNNLPNLEKLRYGSSNLRLSRTNSALDKKKSKRTKERKIGYIIEKVNTWRKLYNGFHDEMGKFTKYSLDEAAKIIGISKKSLDDYLLQLRLGRKYGFDFNFNKNSKVGVLRSFVRKNRNPKADV